MQRKFLPILILIIATGCQQNTGEVQLDQTIVKLQEYNVFVSNEDYEMGVPSILRADHSGKLWIYDSSSGLVYQIDTSAKTSTATGRAGRGPGEYVRVQNFFVNDRHLFITDNSQQLIHKYHHDDGYISSFNYRPGQTPRVPPPAPLPPLDLAYIDIGPTANFNNQPHVTTDGDVLIYDIADQQTLYTMFSWQGDSLGTIGNIPDNRSFDADYERFRSEIYNRQTPSLFIPDTFVVNDRSGSDEFFLIHSSIPLITKYSTDGIKLWEKRISDIAEIEYITERYFESMDAILNITDTMFPLRKYTTGVSTDDGGLFLAVYTYPGLPLWIHHFDNEGELLARYEIESATHLYPVFDIDHENNAFLIPDEDGDIRSYTF
ncbi:MAG: 6-bladed beta-propeller [Balneolaceae bacterium]|nr:MAG: 6-bladed beta-propeller [Balneolaceae bacterium]